MPTKKRKKRNPVKTAERKEAKAWRERALKRAGNRCEWCGSTHYLNVHHIISRKYKPLRIANDNSLVLCAKCHKFGIGYAAHENPLIVARWLFINRKESFYFLMNHSIETFQSLFGGMYGSLH